MADDRDAGTHGHSHDHAHDHGHAHGHDHDRTFQPDLEDTPPSESELMAQAMKELLVEKGVLTADEIRATIERIDGIEPSLGGRIVENTPARHNLIVCTLCSCYPRQVLGLPPDWYKSRAYRSRAVIDPRGVLGDFGTTIPDDVAVSVHDSTADVRYLVLPLRPEGTDGMSEAELANLLTRDALVGVTLPKAR